MKKLSIVSQFILVTRLGMKNVLMFAIAIVIATSLLSQTVTDAAKGGAANTSKPDSTGINKVKEPQYNDIFFLLDTASGNLIELERQTLEVKIHPHGFGGAESDLRLKGEKSPVRFKKEQRLDFIVRVPSPETDPHAYLLLYSLETKKNGRSLEVAKAGYAGLSRKTVLDKSAIRFDATKYGVSSFKIRAVQALAVGEYLLLTKDAKDGFAFGIE